MKPGYSSSMVLLLAAGSAFAGIQAQVQTPGCDLDFQDHYTCNRDSFQQKLTVARTIRIDTDRMDLFAARRVGELVQSLGKTTATSEQRPDLVFALSPVDRSGKVELSPAAVALATLSVYGDYDPSPGSGRRRLIWVETLDGSTDRPWPSVVIDLLQKFKGHALTH